MFNGGIGYEEADVAMHVTSSYKNRLTGFRAFERFGQPNLMSASTGLPMLSNSTRITSFFSHICKFIQVASGYAITTLGWPTVG